MEKAPGHWFDLGLFVVLPFGGFVWWSRGESNPRPQAITGQFYMLSCLI